MPKLKYCPKCKSEKVFRIVYGLIEHPKDLRSDEIPGGCCVCGDEDPKWHCDSCSWRWGGSMDYYYNGEE